MKKNIFVYFVVTIVIAISITGFFIFQQVQKNYKTDSQEKLLRLTKVIASGVDSHKTTADNILDYNNLAKEYSDIINKQYNSEVANPEKDTRITFINTDGKVLGDSTANYIEMENHLNRTEVQDALSGKTGIEIRYSSTLKMNFIYCAELLPSKNIIVRVSMPLKNLQEIYKQIWIITLIGILVGLILSSFIAFKFSARIVTPITRHIKSINKELFRTIEDLKDKNVKMDAILNSMNSSIIGVDSELKILLYNTSTLKIFTKGKDTEIVGKSLIELIRNSEINDFIIDTIKNNKINSGEVHIYSPFDRILNVTTAPIRSKDDNNTTSGGVVVMDDITNLKKLEQIRTEFVSNVTHELKTPLTSIKGFIETLKNGAIENREIAYSFLDIIDIEAERLTILINDILNLSEIETKQQDTNISSYMASDVVNEVIPMLEEVAARKDVKIHWNIDNSAKMQVNKDRIKQLLINIIDNAVKYNYENGEIFVNVARSVSGIEIRIKDTGIGIAEENLTRIFERFYRVDKGRSRSMGGTGLGLSIVKHIVNLYNGTIKINSTVGKGTEFIINLPV